MATATSSAQNFPQGTGFPPWVARSRQASAASDQFRHGRQPAAAQDSVRCHAPRTPISSSSLSWSYAQPVPAAAFADAARDGPGSALSSTSPEAKPAPGLPGSGTGSPACPACGETGAPACGESGTPPPPGSVLSSRWPSPVGRFSAITRRILPTILWIPLHSSISKKISNSKTCWQVMQKKAPLETGSCQPDARPLSPKTAIEVTRPGARCSGHPPRSKPGPGQPPGWGGPFPGQAQVRRRRPGAHRGTPGTPAQDPRKAQASAAQLKEQAEPGFSRRAGPGAAEPYWACCGAGGAPAGAPVPTGSGFSAAPRAARGAESGVYCGASQWYRRR